MLGTIDRGHVTRIVESLSRADGAGIACAKSRELDRDAPDYDRALVDLAALPAAHCNRADRAGGGAAGRGIRRANSDPPGSGACRAEDVQLYYQIALGRPPRSWPWRPNRGSGFEMTLLRMLAFRPDGDGTAQREPKASGAVTAPVASIGSAASAAPVARGCTGRSGYFGCGIGDRCGTHD